MSRIKQQIKQLGQDVSWGFTLPTKAFSFPCAFYMN